MMLSWLSGKLFDLAVRLDWEVAASRARVVVLIDRGLDEAFFADAPKKRTGRPKGAKDGVGPKAAPKRTRKPKVTA